MPRNRFPERLVDRRTDIPEPRSKEGGSCPRQGGREGVGGWGPDAGGCLESAHREHLQVEIGRGVEEASANTPRRGNSFLRSELGMICRPTEWSAVGKEGG